MYKLRLAKPEDTNFIANSYLKSYRDSPEASAISEQGYYPLYKHRLEAMSEVIIIACSPEDDNQILGYVITNHDGTLVHYVYVKYPFRGHKIGTALVSAASAAYGNGPVVVTHQPKNWRAVSTKHNLIFEPQHVRTL